MASPISYPSPSTSDPNPPSAFEQQQQQQATIAHIEQVRLLVLGMEQRLQKREEKLTKSVERAENEGRKFEELRNEIMADS